MGWGGVGHSSSPCDKGRGRWGKYERLNTVDSFLNTATGFLSTYRSSLFYDTHTYGWEKCIHMCLKSKWSVKEPFNELSVAITLS